MSTEKDWIDFRKAVRLTRELFDQEAFKPFSNGEIKPGVNVKTDEQINNFIRSHAESAYHPCGTCRMGSKDNPASVVDEETRVIGIDCLRVADSSIFPQIPNGNLNAPSIMVGEKASDFILGMEPLAKANITPWTHPNWETQQR